MIYVYFISSNFEIDVTFLPPTVVVSSSGSSGLLTDGTCSFVNRTVSDSMSLLYAEEEYTLRASMVSMNCDLLVLSEWTWNTFPLSLAVSPLKTLLVPVGLLFVLGGLLLGLSLLFPVAPSFGRLPLYTVVGVGGVHCAPGASSLLAVLIFFFFTFFGNTSYLLA